MIFGDVSVEDVFFVGVFEFGDVSESVGCGL